MAAITGAEGQHSRDIGRDLPLKTAVLHKRRCSTSAITNETINLIAHGAGHVLSSTLSGEADAFRSVFGF